MSKGIDACERALERLINGKPNNPNFLGVKITASIVSQEAGFDSGYLKKSRHPVLISKIQLANEAFENSQKKVSKQDFDKVQRQATTASSDSSKYKTMLDAALTREIILIKRIRELEAQLGNSNQ